MRKRPTTAPYIVAVLLVGMLAVAGAVTGVLAQQGEGTQLDTIDPQVAPVDSTYTVTGSGFEAENYIRVRKHTATEFDRIYVRASDNADELTFNLGSNFDPGDYLVSVEPQHKEASNELPIRIVPGEADGSTGLAGSAGGTTQVAGTNSQSGQSRTETVSTSSSSSSTSDASSGSGTSSQQNAGGVSGVSQALLTRLGDNASSIFSSSGFTESSPGDGKAFGGTHHTAPANSNPPATATWTFTDLPTGIYEVSTTWREDGSNSTQAPYVVTDASGEVVTSENINQQAAPVNNSHAQEARPFQTVGDLVAVDDGTITVTLTSASDGTVVADAVHIAQLVVPSPSPGASPSPSGNPTSGPFLTSISPTAALPGTHYTATGGGFANFNHVLVRSQRTGQTNRLFFTAPANATTVRFTLSSGVYPPGVYFIAVETADGRKSNELTITVTEPAVTPSPVITPSLGPSPSPSPAGPFLTSISPTAALPGTHYTATGGGFANFNHVLVRSQRTGQTNRLFFTAPANATTVRFTLSSGVYPPGVYFIAVETADGRKSNELTITVTEPAVTPSPVITPSLGPSPSPSPAGPFLTSISPTAALPGTHYTATGGGFANFNHVLVRSQRTGQTNRLFFTAPANATTVRFTLSSGVYPPGVYFIAVETADGRKSNELTITVTEPAVTPSPVITPSLGPSPSPSPAGPFLTSISPTAALPGTHYTATGGGFANFNHVLVRSQRTGQTNRLFFTAPANATTVRFTLSSGVYPPGVYFIAVETADGRKSNELTITVTEPAVTPSPVITPSLGPSPSPSPAGPFLTSISPTAALPGTHYTATGGGFANFNHVLVRSQRTGQTNRLFFTAPANATTVRFTLSSGVYPPGVYFIAVETADGRKSNELTITVTEPAVTPSPVITPSLGPSPSPSPAGPFLTSISPTAALPGTHYTATGGGFANFNHVLVRSQRTGQTNRLFFTAPANATTVRFTLSSGVYPPGVYFIAVETADGRKSNELTITVTEPAVTPSPVITPSLGPSPSPSPAGPFLTSISPTAALPGTHYTATGGGFANFNHVLVRSQRTGQTNRLFFTAPANATTVRFTLSSGVYPPGVYFIAVETADGRKSNELTITVTEPAVTPSPVITPSLGPSPSPAGPFLTSISPTAALPGTHYTATGGGFANFNHVLVRSQRTGQTNRLFFTAPANATTVRFTLSSGVYPPGVYFIAVETADGRKSNELTITVTEPAVTPSPVITPSLGPSPSPSPAGPFLTSISPTAALPGTHYTATGGGFANFNHVLVRSQRTGQTNRLFFTAPANATTVRFTLSSGVYPPGVYFIAVETADGRKSNELTITVTEPAVTPSPVITPSLGPSPSPSPAGPFLTSISPTAALPGTHYTATGGGFANFNHVLVRSQRTGQTNRLFFTAPANATTVRFTLSSGVYPPGVYFIAVETADGRKSNELTITVTEPAVTPSPVITPSLGPSPSPSPAGPFLTSISPTAALPGTHYTATGGGFANFNHVLVRSQRTGQTNRLFFTAPANATTVRFTLSSGVYPPGVYFIAVETADGRRSNELQLTVLGPSPTPDPLRIQYTVFGDSIGVGAVAFRGYASRYEDAIEDASNFTVDRTNRSRSGARSIELATSLTNDPSFRSAAQVADIISWNIGGNDLRDARSAFRNGTCGGADNRDCLRDTVSNFRTNWNTIVSQLQSLRQHTSVPLRTFDVYNPFVDEDQARDSWPHDSVPNDFEALKPFLDQINAHIHGQAGSLYRVGQVAQAFNGSNGQTDPEDLNLLSLDGFHPNDAGHRVIADQLTALGFTGLPTDGVSGNQCAFKPCLVGSGGNACLGFQIEVSCSNPLCNVGPCT